MLVFSVPEMHCDGCIRALTGAVRDVDGQATLEADLKNKQVRVASTATSAALAEAMREAGFDVEPV
jgi:copper chaperone